MTVFFSPFMERATRSTFTRYREGTLNGLHNDLRWPTDKQVAVFPFRKAWHQFTESGELEDLNGLGGIRTKDIELGGGTSFGCATRSGQY